MYARDTKLPSDLKGLSLLVYDPNASPEHEIARECAKVRPLLVRFRPREALLPGAGLVGTWWQFALGRDGDVEHSAVSLMMISRRDDGSLKLKGQSWSAEGTFIARYESRATALNKEGLFYYYWEGEWPTQPGVPAFYGKGEIRPSSQNRASGYFTTRSDTHPEMNAKIAVEYLRAQPKDSEIFEGSDAKARASLIQKRLRDRAEIAHQ